METTLAPTDRTRQVEETIALIESGMSERAACEKVGINRGTFRSACLRFEAADQYARALTALAHDQVNRIEDTIEDMRDARIDDKIARIEIDARKWLSSKLLPRMYGDAKRLEHTGADGKPLNLTVLDPDAVVDQIVSIATEYPQAAPKLRALLQSALDRIA
jgi:hypothetical protein